MAVALTQTSGVLKRFRRTVSQFQHQVTFQTPSKTLGPFSKAIVSALHPFQKGSITIDEVVFEPRRLNSILAERAILVPKMDSTQNLHDWSLDSDLEEEVEALLTAILSDAVDFAFVPTPKRFMMYSDHDEYTTFFSVTKAGLNRIATPMAQEGFVARDYLRKF